MTLIDRSLSGIEVWDSLTERHIKVKCGIGLVPADLPALAKLGDHASHSAQASCHRDGFMGHICGHKLDDPRPPPRYDNYAVGFPKPIIHGDSARKKVSGEHYAFTETNSVPLRLYRNEGQYRAAMQRVAALHRDPNASVAAYDRLRKQTGVREESCLLAIPESQFRLTRDMLTDQLHLVAKGILHKLFTLTFKLGITEKRWTIRHSDARMLRFQNKLKVFCRLPGWMKKPRILTSEISGSSAEEIMTFFRVYALGTVVSELPPDVVRVWVLAVHLFSGISHYKVPKSWMNSPTSGFQLLLRKFIDAFLSVFGPCNLPPNFHLLLHQLQEFRDWGPAVGRSCWKNERGNKYIIGLVRMSHHGKLFESLTSHLERRLTMFTDSLRVAQVKIRSPMQHLQEGSAPKFAFVKPKSFSSSQTQRRSWGPW